MRNPLPYLILLSHLQQEILFMQSEIAQTQHSKQVAFSSRTKDIDKTIREIIVYLRRRDRTAAANVLRIASENGFNYE